METRKNPTRPYLRKEACDGRLLQALHVRDVSGECLAAADGS